MAENAQYIFTTNYDSNLDIVTGVSIHHLHGAFNILVILIILQISVTN